MLRTGSSCCERIVATTSRALEEPTPSAIVPCQERHPSEKILTLSELIIKARTSHDVVCRGQIIEVPGRSMFNRLEGLAKRMKGIEELGVCFELPRQSSAESVRNLSLAPLPAEKTRPRLVPEAP